MPDRLTSVARCLLAGVALIALHVAPAHAKADFSRSRIAISPAAPSEGDVVTFTIDVINSGDEGAPFADVKFELPLEAMFVDVDGIDGVRTNLRDKVLGGTMALEAGETRTFRVRMVIPRDAGGHLLTPDLTVRYFHQGVEFYGHETYDIGTRVASGGVDVGPVNVTPAGLAVLVFVAALPLLWLALTVLLSKSRARDERGAIRGSAGRLIGPAAAAFALLLPLPFWTFFAVMAVRDWQSLRAWPQTSCVITDSRIREDESTASGGDGGGLLRRTRTMAGRSYEPLLALRYTVGERPMISTGFHTGSHLRVGGAQQAQSAIARWPIGATVPCWYNPNDPGDVVVRNGLGGAYVFALFPLPVALFGVSRVRALMRGRRA